MFLALYDSSRATDHSSPEQCPPWGLDANVCRDPLGGPSRMPQLALTVNEQAVALDVDPQTPLLWVLRDALGLTGTKYGCGMGLCGACTVHIDGNAVRACLIPVSTVGMRKITTIEGLSADARHPVQRAWIALQVPQC